MKLLSRLVIIALSASSVAAYADTTSAPASSNLTNASANSSSGQIIDNNDALTQEIADIQQQIKILQSKIASQQDSVQAFSGLSKADKTAGRPHAHVDVTQNVAFEQFPSTSFSLALLKIRNQFDNHDLVIGGYFEQDTQYWGGDNLPTTTTGYTYNTGSEASITTVKLDAMSNLNDWATAFASLNDSAPGSSDNVNMAKAFILIGNLDKSPLYAMVGKNYLPFGIFGGGGPWTAPTDRLYFRPNETANAAVGYYQDGLNTNLAVFSNNSATNPKSTVGDFAYNVNYNQTQGVWTYNMGAGYLNDMRGTSSAIGSDTSLNTGRNAAWDVNAGVGYQVFVLGGEFLQGTQSVLNNSGLPRAWNISASISPTIYGKATTFLLSRDTTTNLNGVPVGLSGDATPGAAVVAGIKNQWTVSATREVIDNIYVGLEYDYANTYANQMTYATTLDISAYF